MEDINRKALKTLEYNIIIDKVVSYASSEPGKRMVRSLMPYDTFDKTRVALLESNDALARISRKGSMSFQKVKRVDDSLMRLEVGSTLSIRELLDIKGILECAHTAIDYDEGEDCLSGYFRELDEAFELRSEIGRCILSEDEISDDASPRLREIRRSLRLMDDRIHTELTNIINSASTRTYLQDAVITTRNGRYCVPVKSEYRGSIQGMIHDESSSGATVFIEPMAVIKLNNEMRQLEADEIKEIEVILARLSNEAAGYSGIIKNDVLVLTHLDFVMAKGLYAKEMNAIMPNLNHKGRIDIRQGRHPLIDKNKVVPVDIHLDSDTSMVIITGPNTGGKTVSLKTVGLFAAMTGAGILIPARLGSSMSVFDKIFADIGDEQSIEQSLSTFSSHMVRIVEFMNEITPKSLVLFDELGAGTDPTEGAALATAILDKVHRMNVRCVATTHYSEIKLYALTTEGVCNASCEFDIDTLSPTYRLLMGVPGRSNAFAISKRLGLSDEIIEDAKARVDNENVHFEDVIASLEADKVKVSRDREEAARYKEEISKLREALAKKNDNIESRREEIIRQANEEAKKIILEAKDQVDKAIRNINKYGTVKDLEEERRKLRESIDAAAKKAAPKARKSKALSREDIKEGMYVRIVSLGMEGQVISLPNAKGEVYINSGILNTQVKISDLEYLDEQPVEEKPKAKTGSGKIRMSKGLNVSSEINLIGMTRDEAITALDKYLDDAFLARLSQVRIVHGKGSGVLREAVSEKLRRSKHVKSYRLGMYGEGDAGVTIAELKS